MNAIDILKDDHKKLISVMEQLEVVAKKQTDECDALFQQFKNLYNLHDDAEDKIIYPACKKLPQLEWLVRKSYQAHHVVEVALLELRLMPYTGETWGPKFSVVRDSILTHIHEEENALFSQAASLLSNEELNNLGKQILEQRNKA